MNSDFKDYYEILQVSNNADADVIKKAYITLCKKYHPDINEDKEFATKKIQELNEAKDILSDEAKKAEYDILYEEYKCSKYEDYYNSKRNQEPSYTQSSSNSSSFNNFSTQTNNSTSHLMRATTIKNPSKTKFQQIRSSNKIFMAFTIVGVIFILYSLSSTFSTVIHKDINTINSEPLHPNQRFGWSFLT